MSDALQHPPSFEQMVVLIEKLFKDYLQDIAKKAFTPEEIGKAWERYKTLNHLYRLSPHPGPTWIKASDRLPGYETPVKWRDGNNHSHATDGKIPLIHMAKPFLTGWEWYDESGTAAGREEELWEAFENELYEIYRSEGLANAASKAHSQVYLLKVKFKQKEK